MRVLSIHAGADTGGQGWGLTQAFKGNADIQFRSVARSTNYIDYPHDMDWSEAPAAWDRTHVAHLHNNTRTMRLMGPRKPFVLHHHGTYYRENSTALNLEVERAGARAVVATVDLLRFGNNLTWVPQPHKIPETMRPASRRTKSIRVGHAPTDRGIKDTEAFLAACTKLGVEPVLIEGKSWAECLELKATCDVLYDQVQLGYGNNAVEAWALGIPVIAGATDDILEVMDSRLKQRPFFTATTDTLADAIDAMTSVATRKEWAKIGFDHAKRWHDGTESVKQLTALYHELA